MAQSDTSTWLKCPLDVLHLVCEMLSAGDIANLRLVSKGLAEVGANYLVSNVTFNLSHDSLNRLNKLSQSPLSHHVKFLRYEANMLPVFHSTECYKNFILSNRPFHPDAPHSPSTDMSPREARASMRDFKKFISDPGISKEDLNEHYSTYSALQKAQERLLEKNGEHWATVLKAIPRFHLLKHIKFDNQGRCNHRLSERFREQLQDFPELVNDRVGLPYRISSVPGIRQAVHFMEALSKPGLKIQKFDIGAISPKALKQLKVRNRWNPSEAFRFAEEIKLVFKLDTDSEDEEDEEQEASSCYTIIRKGSLKGIFTSALGLQHMEVKFLDCPMHPDIPLCQIMGSFKWEKLRSISLMSIETNEEELFACLERQGDSLKALRLAFVSLKTGSWISLTDKISMELSLESAQFWGSLRSEENYCVWDMSLIHWDIWDVDEYEYTLQEALDDYVVSGGDMMDNDINPLLLEDEYVDPMVLGLEPSFDSLFHGLSGMGHHHH